MRAYKAYQSRNLKMAQQSIDSFEELCLNVQQLSKSQMLDSEITAVLGPLVAPVCCHNKLLLKFFQKYGWNPKNNGFNSPVDIKKLSKDLQQTLDDLKLVRFYGETTTTWLDYISIDN